MNSHGWCRDGPAFEEVGAVTVHDLVTRQTSCSTFHSSAEWTLNEERDRYTSDIGLPPCRGRPDEQVVAPDPWRVASNTCRKHVLKSANGETWSGPPDGHDPYDGWHTANERPYNHRPAR